MAGVQEIYDYIGWIRDLAKDEDSSRRILEDIGIKTGNFRGGCFEDCYVREDSLDKLQHLRMRFDFSFVPLREER